MLSPPTRHHLAACTCPRCGEPLGRFHVYCITNPVEVLRQHTEFGPMHLSCAQEYAEACHQSEVKSDPSFPRELLYALYTVKGSPASPSARIIRLIEEDEGTACLHLFSPDKITFYHQTFASPHFLTRDATYEEIQTAMQPSLTELLAACQSDAEVNDLEQQITRLHQYLPPRPKPPPASQSSQSGQ